MDRMTREAHTPSDYRALIEAMRILRGHGIIAFAEGLFSDPEGEHFNYVYQVQIEDDPIWGTGDELDWFIVGHPRGTDKIRVRPVSVGGVFQGRVWVSCQF